MALNDILLIAEELVPAYKKIIRGKYAIALAGAHAKGEADAHSDIDIFIYAEGVISYPERKAVFEQIADSGDDFWVSEDIDSLPWGGSIDFVYHGNKIETTVKSIQKLEENLNECIDGKIRIYPEAWTSNGYFNYICLSELDFIQPIDDPLNIINNYKEQIKTFPPKLRKAVIDQFWWKSSFWANNFHYISAVKRGDIVYTSRIISNTIQNMVQVLFALNEVYFHGDKKIELQLKGLKICPKSLIENMELLLSVKRDEAFLEKQRILLSEIIKEIEPEIRKLHLS